ncbi:hypothetical protein PG995_005298 [Apiospora arundinis]
MPRSSSLLFALACQRRFWEAELLLESDVLEIDTPTSDGQTTLEWALSPRHGAPDFAALLLCKGAAIPQRRAQEILGLTQEACNTFNMKAIAGVLSENRSLARCFQVLYNHCVSACSEQKDEIANDFVQKSPAFIVELRIGSGAGMAAVGSEQADTWSHPDPAISMPMEEDISQVAKEEILRTPCRKRKARQADESRPCKRARGRPADPTWRLVEVVSRITPVAQHLCWKRRCALWDDVLGQEAWSSVDLSPYVLAGLPFLSLVVRPGGYGFPVPLVWDEKMQSFSGYNAMNQKWVRITCGEMARMLKDPNVGVVISG